MPTDAVNVGFVPVHEAHAIEQLQATIVFARPLSDSEMRHVMESMTQFEDSLPGFSQIMGMGFAIGPQGVNPIISNAAETPAGVMRTFTNPKGLVIKELKLDRQTLTYRTLEYTRWATVWSEAQNYFSGILPELPSDVNLSGYVLSYSDKFIWRGDVTDIRVDCLLRKGSPYISPETFSANDLWHCHSGKFIKMNDFTKRLTVVDCDCVDEFDSGVNRRVVRIGTTMTEMLNQPGFTQVNIPLPDAMDKINKVFPDLHRSLKDVFASVVNDDVAKIIALQSSVYAS